MKTRLGFSLRKDEWLEDVYHIVDEYGETHRTIEGKKDAEDELRIYFS